MAGCAKSQRKKQRAAIADQEEGLAYAIKLWNDDKEKLEKDQRSLQAICCKAEEEMKKRKKKHITISRATLTRWLEAWCDLLESTIKDNNIAKDCIWAADKTGFQPGSGCRQRVIGPVQRKMQYQQWDGNHENITVMVTICADGGSIAPTIIYKGKHPLNQNIVTEEMMAPSLETSSQGQLTAQEERRKKKKKGQLNSNGLPRLLTGDEFYNHVVEHQNASDAANTAQEDCHKQKEVKSGVLSDWRKVETMRKNRNMACREAYHEAMWLWKEERNVAK
ncbi:hypothetical protein BS17DRAFT_794755 [Gyrodon lividus]|nr:hypothetical protein BS17DRAFT_794755 [Gyrodon lividus]